jgi:hypothetical protein
MLNYYLVVAESVRLPGSLRNNSGLRVDVGYPKYSTSTKYTACITGSETDRKPI